MAVEFARSREEELGVAADLILSTDNVRDAAVFHERMYYDARGVISGRGPPPWPHKQFLGSPRWARVLCAIGYESVRRSDGKRTRKVIRPERNTARSLASEKSPGSYSITGSGRLSGYPDNRTAAERDRRIAPNWLRWKIDEGRRKPVLRIPRICAWENRTGLIAGNWDWVDSCVTWFYGEVLIMRCTEFGIELARGGRRTRDF